MDEEDISGVDSIGGFNTYEEFLDSQITELDLYYLEDEELARKLVELGYRGTGEVLKREEFYNRKQAVENARLSKKNKQQYLADCIAHKYSLEKYPLLHALARREEANRSGALVTIIFLRDKNSKGQEVSCYMDYAHRLKIEDFGIYFSLKEKLTPKPSHLSYFNKETQASTSNSTINYQIIADNPGGLLFKNKRDRKILNVDPKAFNPGDNTIRVAIEDPAYNQVILFDHVTRRKT